MVEDKAERRTFKPGAVVRKAMADDRGRTWMAQHTAAKKNVRNADGNARLSYLLELVKYG